jgi:hypothetical protein
MAQVVLFPPLTWRKRSAPPTATGLILLVFVPSPTWPLKFQPQQYSRLSLVMPQVWTAPAAIW